MPFSTVNNIAKKGRRLCAIVHSRRPARFRSIAHPRGDGLTRPQRYVRQRTDDARPFNYLAIKASTALDEAH